MIYWSLILTGVLITIAGTYFETYHRGKFYSGFYDYLSPNVILTSIGVFLFFKDFVRFDSKIILFFNQYSYGIYLIHMLILTLLKKLGLSYAFIHPIVGIPATSTLCLIISGFIIWGVNKVPWGKYISG
jgi:surface polysaccharide O-acyltransferase-like enzyme